MAASTCDILLLGQTLRFVDNPFEQGVKAATQTNSKGGILIRAGKIKAIGAGDELRTAHPRVAVIDYGDKLLVAGFVDAHVHYPQTAIIASWGKRLIDWLNTYTFPEEMRFDDPHYAATIAERYLDLALSHGTTALSSYCTISPVSVSALFEAAAKRGLCVVAGKTCMDQNAPEGLCDTPQSAYDDSKALLQKYHDKDRLKYAITPRFSPTSSPEQLATLGALWAEHPECLMQTHLSEQVDEIEWVRALFPKARDYLDTYENFGLLGERGVYGHAIHLEPREKDRLKEVGAALVHCPTSNAFIGSGLFDMGGLMTAGQRIGLATDTGGGSSFSMLRTMASAYEIGQLNGTVLHPAELMWLATAGSAKALHLGPQIGTLDPGKFADIVVLDLQSTPAISQRAVRADDLWSALFPTIMMGDDRAIHAVWVQGNLVKTPT
ncbi:guanine deaminase [Rhodobacteraceae bacterium]|nr:guanine deaminase [Paracoccaceae bacterium]